MNFNIKTYGLLCCLLLVNQVLSAQKKSIRFQHYTVEEGLPQNFVDCVLQDSKGFMWFGTWSGLARFDGYAFKEYKQQTKEYSTIYNNFIYALCEDNYGNIWIGTDEGINIYHYDSDTFRRISNAKDEIAALKGKITSIVNAPDNDLWIGTSEGLCRVSIDTLSKITHINTYPFGNLSKQISGTIINDILMDSENNVWVATDNGITLLEGKSGNFKYFVNESDNFNSIPHNSVKCIFEDSKEQIWIGTENGLCRYIPEDQQFHHYFHNANLDYTLPHNYVMDVNEDIKGNILVATFGGLGILKNDQSGRFENYQERAYSEYSLNNNILNCIYRDNRENIWIGTERLGINMYNSIKTEFEYFEHEIAEKNSLNNNVINAVLEDDNNIWIGTSGGGLNRYMKEQGKFKYYKYNPVNDPPFSDFISALHFDRQENLWIGSWGGGLFQMVHAEPGHEKFQVYYPEPDNPYSVISTFISSMTSDAEGNIWIGTYNGIDKYNIEKERFEHPVSIETYPKLTRVGCLLSDHENNIWVGTQNGLFKLTPGKNNNYKVKHFVKSEERQNSLSDNYVTSLYQDSNDQIWVGTYGFGLNRLISEDNGGIFSHVTVEHGLPNDIIYTITEDNLGDLWLTTADGLSRFSPENGKIKNFYVSDGLQNNEYFWNAAFKNKQGKLYFGGMNGLNTFYPDSLSNYQIDLEEQVVITDIEIYNRSVVPNQKYYGIQAIHTSVAATREVNLSYKAREINFEFSALNYEQPASIKYAYKLEGFEDQWNEVSASRRFAGYTNLDPGEYTFRVKSTNNNGEWLDSTTDLKIYIKPPFWSTWWFKILLTGILVVLIISYNRYRIYALKENKKRLEKEVHDRTAEIEEQKAQLEQQNLQIQKQRDELVDLNQQVQAVNELKLKFFTNVSHEFRTPLSLIIGPIERLLKVITVNNSIRNTLILVDKNAQRLLHLINQLMDFRKIEQGKMQLYVSQININDLLNNTIEAFATLAEEKNITLKFVPLNEPGETWVDVKKVEDIFYNLLSNAFKNTPENGTIELKVCPAENDQFVAIEVHDNGFGIGADELKNVFDRFYQVESRKHQGIGTGIGLALTKELVECHKGTITVQSEKGKGTTFIVTIPVRKECYEKHEFTLQTYEPGSILQQVKTFSQTLKSSNGSDLDESEMKPTKFDKSKSTILIVEDNKELRDFIIDNLRSNYNILEAENGVSGFEIAASKNPNIIISDIMMPEMDGLELCQKIKNNLITSHIPVILLTAKGEVEDEILGYKTGADRYVQKPFYFELLETNISSLLESRKKLFDTYFKQKTIDAKVLATTPADEDFLQKIVMVINENMDNPDLSVSFLAKALLLSRGHLHTKLMALANMSPVEFINDIRLKKSIELLQNNTGAHISEIAYSIGFNDPKYFTRVFRRRFGQTPSEYQENLNIQA